MIITTQTSGVRKLSQFPIADGTFVKIICNDERERHFDLVLTGEIREEKFASSQDTFKQNLQCYLPKLYEKPKAHASIQISPALRLQVKDAPEEVKGRISGYKFKARRLKRMPHAL